MRPPTNLTALKRATQVPGKTQEEEEEEKEEREVKEEEEERLDKPNQTLCHLWKSQNQREETHPPPLPLSILEVVQCQPQYPLV